MTDEHKSWLNNLQAGDEVIVRGEWCDRIGTVSKVTVTQIVVGTQRFNKSDGRLRGRGPWSLSHIIRPTQERRDKAELANAKQKLMNLKVDELTLDQCRKILAVAKGNDQ